MRDRFWATPSRLPRDKWRFDTQNSRVRIALDDGFEPGRIYEVDYPATGARVAGVGMAAIRDAASAFRYRTDLPIRGRSTYIFGASQSGRFLRQFLHDGFNVDEEDRRAFDLVWPHIAGAGQGSFNERFADAWLQHVFGDPIPIHGSADRRDLMASATASWPRIAPIRLPKVIYTNTSVEYWGLGRSAALTHMTLDGDPRCHGARERAHLPSRRNAARRGGISSNPGTGEALGNPMPQGNVMRALLRAAHQWVDSGTRPPDSRHPMLRDQTLVAAESGRLPRDSWCERSAHDRRAGTHGPGHFTALPFLVPRVDADGNEVAGIRVPELAVPLATTTGWNFRAERVGNPTTLYALLGSYVPFARTKAEREARHDPRLSVEERYRDRNDYLQRIQAAAAALVKDRFCCRRTSTTSCSARRGTGHTRRRRRRRTA